MPRVVHRTVPVLATLLLAAGCSTVPLDTARRQFHSGYLEAADQSLTVLPANQDKVLNLMERGMIRYLRGDYTNSTRDWLEAVRVEKELEIHSASKAAASMVVNDTMLAFRGYPYERSYIHVFLARSYLARGLWEDAGVEAIGLAKLLEQALADGFPDDAYSRYIAGFCMELRGDGANAAMHYRTAAKLVPGVGLDAGGRFHPPPAGTTNTTRTITTSGQPPPAELICFIDLDGISPPPDYAVILVDGTSLGQSFTLTDISHLNEMSAARMATRHGLKTASRLLLKGAAAMAVASKDRDLGGLTWLLLLAMEEPDTRHWETLPSKLAVARVACPASLRQFDVEFRSGSVTLKRVTVKAPLQHNNRLFVSFCRDQP